MKASFSVMEPCLLYTSSLIRKAIKKILLEKVEKVEITNANLEEYLGKHKFIHNLADKKAQAVSYTHLDVYKRQASLV